MHRQFHLRSITLAILFLLSAWDLPGCSCSSRSSGPTCAILDGIDTAFLGRAVARLPLFEGDRYSRFYVFEVIETFLGNPKPKSLVLVDPDNAGCGASFDRDAVYLVRAQRGKDPWQKVYGRLAPQVSQSLVNSTASIAIYITSQCSGNARVDTAELEIRQLRRWRGTAPGPYLYGLVGLQWKPWQFRYPNPQVLAGAKILLHAANGAREAISGPDGSFEIHDIPPGDYRVSAEKALFRDIGEPRIVTIPKIGCGYFDPILSPDSYIEGLLLHHDGTPARGIPVEAQRRTALAKPEWDSDWTAKTGADGHFRIGPLSDGPHILISNGQRPPMPSQPYPRSFYPGVASESHASLVSVRPTEHRRGLVWILPPPSAVRQVHFRVVWPNGEPVNRAEIRTFVHHRPNDSVETDKRGRAAIDLLADVAYDIEAWVFDFEGNAFPQQFREAWGVSAEFHLPPAKSGTRHTIVLNNPRGISEGGWQ